MAFNINEIRSQLEFGGARPSLFQVAITNPIDGTADLKLPFLVTSAAIPESVIGVVPVPYFGRIIKVPGTRQFAPWTTTIINDEDFLVRNALEGWHNAINALERNISTNGSAPAAYKTQATITQYGKDGTELRVYQFNGLWPSQVDPIQTDWGAGDQLEQFNCTWEYDNYEVVGGNTGLGGGR